MSILFALLHFTSLIERHTIWVSNNKLLLLIARDFEMPSNLFRAMLCLAVIAASYQLAPPLALHQLVPVDACSNSVVRLRGYDITDPNVRKNLHCRVEMC